MLSDCSPSSPGTYLATFPRLFLNKQYIIAFTVFFVLSAVNAAGITDNTCTFKDKGKLFSLVYLNMKSNTTANYYTVKANDTTKV